MRLYQTLWQVEHCLDIIKKEQGCGHNAKMADRLWSIAYEQRRVLRLGPSFLRSRPATGVSTAARDCVACCATVLQAIQQGQRQAFFASMMAGGGPSGKHGTHQSHIRDSFPCAQ